MRVCLLLCRVLRPTNPAENHRRSPEVQEQWHAPQRHNCQIQHRRSMGSRLRFLGLLTWPKPWAIWATLCH